MEWLTWNEKNNVNLTPFEWILFIDWCEQEEYRYRIRIFWSQEIVLWRTDKQTYSSPLNSFKKTSNLYTKFQVSGPRWSNLHSKFEVGSSYFSWNIWWTNILRTVRPVTKKKYFFEILKSKFAQKCEETDAWNFDLFQYFTQIGLWNEKKWVYSTKIILLTWNFLRVGFMFIH